MGTYDLVDENHRGDLSSSAPASPSQEQILRNPSSPLLASAPENLTFKNVDEFEKKLEAESEVEEDIQIEERGMVEEKMVRELYVLLDENEEGKIEPMEGVDVQESLCNVPIMRATDRLNFPDDNEESLISAKKFSDSSIYWEVDLRERVPKIWRFPYNAITLLNSTYEALCPFGEKNAYGTAFMIGQNVALTAAHNVIDSTELFYVGQQLRLSKEILCHFGSDGKSAPREAKSYESTVVTGYVFPELYLQEEEHQKHDFALLIFKGKIVDKINKIRATQGKYTGVGMLKLIPYEEEVIENHDSQEVIVSGYPGSAGVYKEEVGKKKGDDVFGFQYEHKNCLAKFPQKLEELRICPEKNILHKVDTSRGQSGAPIILCIEDQIAGCIGIHTGGFPRTQDRFNKGIRVTQDLRETLIGWINNFETVTKTNMNTTKGGTRYINYNEEVYVKIN